MLLERVLAGVVRPQSHSGKTRHFTSPSEVIFSEKSFGRFVPQYFGLFGEQLPKLISTEMSGFITMTHSLTAQLMLTEI